MAGCQKRGVIIPKLIPKKASPFPEPTSNISTWLFVFGGVEQTPKPTQTLPYLTASSLIRNRLPNRRERAKLYPCLSFLNQVLTLHPAKCLENYSYCRRNTLSFSQRVRVAEDNRWDFTREINSCSLPAHSSGKLPPLCGIKGNHPHRNVEVVWLQWQGKIEICTWFNCHHRVLKVRDCSAKHSIFFLWENSVLQRA